MSETRGWKALDWRGKVNVVKFVPAPIPEDLRKEGENVYTFFSEPLTYCGICGSGIYHHWVFERHDGATMAVGSDCAEVVLGMTPAAYVKDATERRAAEDAIAREAAAQAEARAWLKGDEQHGLRLALVLGARRERQSRTLSNFYSRAYASAKRGAMTPKFREWVERSSRDGVRAVVDRTAAALWKLDALQWAKLSMYDAPIIGDMVAREFPPEDRKIMGAPLSANQCALIDRLAHRYRKQIEKRQRVAV